MSSRLGTLTLDLVAKTGSFTGPIDKARGRANRTFTQMRKGANLAAKAFVGLSAAGVAALSAIVKSGLEAADQQAKLANAVGGTVTGLQSLERAAGRAGVATGSLRTSAEKLGQRLGEAINEGTGSAADALDALGISARDLAEADVDERFALIAERVEELGLNAIETSGYLRDLGIRDAKVVNLILSGADAIRESREQIERYGAALSEVDAAQVEAANDAFGEFGIISDGLRQQFAAQFAPIITGISQDLTKAIEEAGGLGNVAEDTFDKIIGGARFVGNAVDGIGRTFDIAANAIVVTFAGALDVLSGGAAQVLSILNSIPTIRLAIDQRDIDSLRDFQQIQKQVAREGVSAIGEELDRELSGDALVRNYEEYKQAGEEAAQQAVRNKEAQRDLSQTAIAGTKEQTKAQDEYLKKLKETQDVLNSQQIGGLDGQFEQYLNLAKSDIVSGSRFLEDRISTLKNIIEAQKQSGQNPDSIALRESLVAQLEQGILPQQSGQKDQAANVAQQALMGSIADASKLARESLDLTRLIHVNTDVIAAKITEGVANVGQLTIKVAGKDGQVGFEGQVNANTETLEELKAYVEQITQNEARAAAGG